MIVRVTTDRPPARADPEALLASKGGAGAYLSFTTHALAENRHGLIVDVHTTQATGTAEREAALMMVKRSVTPADATRQPTLAADRGYDTADFIAALSGERSGLNTACPGDEFQHIANRIRLSWH